MAPCFSFRRLALLLLAVGGCAGATIDGTKSVGGTSTGTSSSTGGAGGPSTTLITLGDAGVQTPGTTSYVKPTIKKFPESATCTGQTGKFGEAFQKALWFFNVNKAGTGISSTYVQWRGDAHVDDAHIPLKTAGTDLLGTDMSQAFISANKSILDPDGNGEVDLGGGYHDAGDYIKFGLTTGFMASTLAWSMYEYPTSYKDTGLESEAIKLLKWATDYFMRSTFLDGNGNLVAFAHQVGDDTDHTCGWMPPELRLTSFCPRKAYFITAEKPGADVAGMTAAALANTYLLLKDKDPAYADKALKIALALYAHASKYPDQVANTTNGLYTSEYAADDLSWAAVWLYLATGDWKYIEEVIGSAGWLNKMPGFRYDCLQWDSICWSESHTHCWNSLRSGVFLKLAQILRDKGDSRAKGVAKIARWDSMKWPTGGIKMSPAGFSVSYDYGSARYNSAAQFVALTYAKIFGSQDADGKNAIITWAKRQIDYILGDNPLGKSYMMGYSNKFALQPHHAAGHASIYGEPDVPAENRHIVWGALVNGPDANDRHVDKRADFGSNEITIDYNVSLVAALSAHYALQGAGQCPMANFPPIEPEIDEYYTLSNLNAESTCKSQINMTLVNETIHPPRYNTHLSFKYFFDIKELLDQGKSIDDVTATLVYDRGGSEFKEPTTISPIKPCPKSNTTFYVEMGLEGYKHWGKIVKLKAPRTVMLEIGVAHNPGCVWDPSNDWSYEGLKVGHPSVAPKTPHIAVYSEGLLAWGQEPTCFEEKATQPPPIWVP